MQSTFSGHQSNGFYQPESESPRMQIKVHENFTGHFDLQRTRNSAFPRKETPTMKRMTVEQKDLFVYLIERNIDQIFMGSLSDREKIWKVIAGRLNYIGPRKEPQDWRRCWGDIKSKAKEKRTKIRSNSNCPLQLTEIDNRVLKLCVYDKYRYSDTAAAKLLPPATMEKELVVPRPPEPDKTFEQIETEQRRERKRPLDADMRTYKDIALSSLRAQEESLTYLRKITEQNAIIIELLKVGRDPLI